MNRRKALRGAASVAGVGAVGAFTATATAAVDPGNATTQGPLRVRKLFQLIDKDDKQRFLLQSSKPPVILNGQVFPPERRGGDKHASYFIFNDQNQNERGGITVDPVNAQLSFDYPTVDALHLSAVNVGAAGAAQLSMREMPDPSIPIEELTPEDAPPRVLLGTDNVGDGSLLFLYDSNGRPRIVLQVDGEDVPRIQILDADGSVVSQLPPAEDAARAAQSPRQLSPLLEPSAPGL